MKTILERLERGELAAQEAIRQLIGAGADPEFAREAVFIQLGGSDLVAPGADGIDRYEPSGRLVQDVLAELER